MTFNAGNARYRWALSGLAALLLVLVGASPASAGVDGREADPVVLTGAQTPALVGVAPDQVVAFSWIGSWKQIPVQVDERKIASYRIIRNQPTNGSERDLRTEVYADPKTFAGADGVAQMTTIEPFVPIPGTAGDPNLDNDDEIVFMSKDSGKSALGQPDPAGVDGGTRTPVRIEDPLGTGAASIVYLFKKTGGLDPAAATDYVSYEWKFEPALKPDYFTGYRFFSVSPEASSVETALYRQAFPGRWLVDGFNIKAGAATGVDILDGDKSPVGPFGCIRNEYTFSRGGGGFIAAIDGPVRAIRSYIGANSGTYTQRDQIHYEGRIDTTTFLRVHKGINNTIIAMDYSEEAKGMTYRNSNNPAGVTIDGVPDEIVNGEPKWEQVDGAQGSLTMVARATTDISPITFSTFYLDNDVATGSSMLCSGDDHAIGASGPMADGLTEYNTDPTRTAEELKNFTSDRFTYIDPPGTEKEAAIHHAQQIDSPLVLATGAGTDPIEPDDPSDPNGSPPKVGPLKMVVRPTVKGKKMRVNLLCSARYDRCTKAKAKVVVRARGKVRGFKKPLLAKRKNIKVSKGKTRRVYMNLTGKARKIFKHRKFRKNGKKRTRKGAQKVRANIRIDGKKYGVRTVLRIGRVR